MIPLIKPGLDFDQVAEDIKTILDSGQLTNGRYVSAFQRALADYIGTAHAVSTTSATTALHLLLVAMGIGSGDEVLVSDFSYPASGNAVAQTGARPVLVDCLPGRFDIDPDAIEQNVSSRSRAVMVVHPFGQPVEMMRINAVAGKHGIRVIEDAACGLGAQRDGGMCGALSLAGCFSFHPRKLLTTGEGGMIVTDDRDLADRLAILSRHGGQPAKTGLTFVAHGFNYRMSEIQAVLGLHQLSSFDALLAKRRQLARAYMAGFSLIDGVRVPLSASVDDCTFQSFVVLLDQGIDRDRIISELRSAGIESTLGTYAMHSQPAFARYGYVAGALPHSMRAQDQSLTLPLSADMDRDQITYIVETLGKLV